MDELQPVISTLQSMITDSLFGEKTERNGDKKKRKFHIIWRNGLTSFAVEQSLNFRGQYYETHSELFCLK